MVYNQDKARSNMIVGFAQLVAGNVLYKIGVACFAGILGRLLGPDNFGLFAFSQTLAGFLVCIYDPGIGSVLLKKIQEKSNEKNNIIVSAGSIIRVAMTTVSLFVLAVIAILLGHSGASLKIIMIIGSSVMAMSLAETYLYIFKALMKTNYVAYTDLFKTLLIIICIVIIITFHPDLYGFSWIYFAQCLVTLIFVLFLLFKLNIKLRFQKIKYVIKVALFSFPFAVQQFAITIYLYIDSIMLSMFIGMEAVGFYQASYKLISALNIIGSSLYFVVFPRYVKYYKEKNTGNLSKFVSQTFKWQLIIAFLMCTTISCFADEIIYLWYGNKFHQSIMILRILIWAEGAIYLSFLATGLLLIYNKKRVLMVQGILAATVNLVFNFPAIIIWGAFGAAAVTCFTEIFVFIYLMTCVYKLQILSLRSLLSHSSRCMFCSLLLAIFIIFLKDIIFWPVLVFISVLVFILLILLFKLISREEKYYAKHYLLRLLALVKN